MIHPKEKKVKLDAYSCQILNSIETNIVKTIQHYIQKGQWNI